MPQSCSTYDPSIRKELDESDWDTVLPKVLKYARSRTKLISWLGHKVGAEELVQQAIARAYGVGERETYRNWNKKTCSDLSNFLIGIIRSITSHLAEHEADFPEESLYNEDGSPEDGKLFDATGASNPKTPEERLIEKENLKTIIDTLDDLENEDEYMGLVILCIKDGISKPLKISEETDIEVKDVYNILKRLRRKLNRFNPKKREKSSIERREE